MPTGGSTTVATTGAPDERSAKTDQFFGSRKDRAHEDLQSKHRAPRRSAHVEHLPRPGAQRRRGDTQGDRLRAPRLGAEGVRRDRARGDRTGGLVAMSAPRILGSGAPPLPDKRYRTIVVDPPW